MVVKVILKFTLITQDYEEEVQDDDGLVDLGIEDEEELKEVIKLSLKFIIKATYRTAGGKESTKINFEEETVQKKKSTEKNLKKTLRKLDNNALDSDDENPYATSESDDEKSEPEQPKKKIKEIVVERVESRATSPIQTQVMKASSPLALLEALKKGKKGNNSPNQTKNPKAQSPLRNNDGINSPKTMKTNSPLNPNPGQAKSPPRANSPLKSEVIPGRSPLNNGQAKSPNHSPNQTNSPKSKSSSSHSSQYPVGKTPHPSKVFATSPLSGEVISKESPNYIPKLKLKLTSSAATSPVHSPETDLKRKRPQEQDAKRVTFTLILFNFLS